MNVRFDEDDVALCETALVVLEMQWATIADLRQALVWRRNHRPQIGKLALTRRVLTMDQVFEILGHQAISGGYFGQIAVQSGFLDEAKVCELLDLQNRLTPSMTDALVGLGVITVEQALVVMKQIKDGVKRAFDPRLNGSERSSNVPATLTCGEGTGSWN